MPSDSYANSINASVPERSWKERVKQGLGMLGASLMALFKFGLPLLKTGGSMFLYMFLYAQIFGTWSYSIGVVLSIFVHEMGHYIALVLHGVRVTAMNFIPFVGAYVAYQNMPRNAWVESIVALSGPLAGAGAALLSSLIYHSTNNPVFLAIAYFGYFVNLLNLIPIGILDGSKISAAIPPLGWLIGLPILILLEFVPDHFNLALLGVIIFGLPRIWQAWQGKLERRDRECTPEQRWIVTGVYFALILAMAWLSNSAYNSLNEIIPNVMSD